MHQLNETNYKSRIEELENEIRLQITCTHESSTDTNKEMDETKNELRNALQKISENNRELRELRSECKQLNVSYHEIEKKYNMELATHSEDVKNLINCKDDLNDALEKLSKLTSEHEQIQQQIQSYHSNVDVTSSQHLKEKQELETRLADLIAQNTALLDQIQVSLF